MARIIEQTNVWGRSQGQEAQRLDLWVLDMTNAVKQIAEQLSVQLPDIPGYFASSITLPELRIQPEVVRRDSRPYNMPSWDLPVDVVRVNFIMDANPDRDQPAIYQVLDSWRTLVRAGRGAMSTEMSFHLNSNYRIDYNFDLLVYLLRGGSSIASSRITSSLTQQLAFSAARTFGAFANQWNNPITRALRDRVQNFAEQQDFQQAGESDEDYQDRINEQVQMRQQIINANIAAQDTQAALTYARARSWDPAFKVYNNNLEISAVLLLKRAWLSSYKVGLLDYGNNGTLMIEGAFYVEDIVRQVASGNQPNSFPGVAPPN
jgi:hypothetical protein